MYKKIVFTLFILIILGINSYAQQETYKYRCFEDELYSNGSESGWQPVNILVTINSEKVRVFASREFNIDIISVGDVKKNEKSNRVLEMIGVDEFGTKCKVRFTKFENPTGEHIATLTVVYSDIEYYFRLKDN